MSHRRFWSLGLLFVLGFGGASGLAADEPRPARGPRVHAIEGVRIFVAPGRTLEDATLVLREGLVEAVGEAVETPADARSWDHRGRTIYPGFIESYLAVPWPPQDVDLSKDGPLGEGGNPDPRVHPGRDASRLALPSEGLKALRDAGFTTALVAPGDGIFRGSGAVLNLGSGGSRANLLQDNVTQHLGLEASKRGSEGYGDSKMGVATLIRQTFLDALWYAGSHSRWRAATQKTAPGKAGQKVRTQKRPIFDRALRTLVPAAQGEQLVIFETDDLLGTLRAGRFAAEFSLQAAAVGTGREYQRLPEIQAMGLPILLPLPFPEPPEAQEEGEDDLTVGLAELRHWDAAPNNPGSLIEAGVTIAFTGHRLENPSDLFPAVGKALERGLTEDEALAALTTTPAKLLDVPGLTGTLEAGSLANFFVVEGPLWTKDPKILEVWIDGSRYRMAEPEGMDVDPTGRWDLRLLVGDGAGTRLELRLKKGPEGLSGGTIAPDSLEARAASAEPAIVPLDSATLSKDTLKVAFDGRQLDLEGTVTLRLELRGDQAKGLGQGPDGEFAVQGNRAEVALPDDEISTEASLEELLDRLEDPSDGPPREPQG